MLYREILSNSKPLKTAQLEQENYIVLTTNEGIVLVGIVLVKKFSFELHHSNLINILILSSLGMILFILI